jgi:hypothetical protein
MISFSLFVSFFFFFFKGLKWQLLVVEGESLILENLDKRVGFEFAFGNK